ncbi:MAG: hypothetical protein V3T14_08070, partial [Myxococcota bacterium]
GKIEDGLPRWHLALRDKEYAAIDEALTQPGVHFVPNTRVGRDVELQALTDDWGFQAVVLANGAWRDRPLPIEGSDAYVGKGLVYQNPFIHWFNHYLETGYSGEHYEIMDGTAIIGGGLASIDVAKVVQLELALRALAKRGIEEDLVRTEVKGIPETLKRHGLTWEELGLKGVTLYYRRRIEDMPLVEIPESANEARREKIAKTRTRLLDKAISKYLFHVEPLHAPVGLLTEGDRLDGLRFARTRVEAGRVSLTEETVDVRAPMVISSIGSIPEALPGIAMRGELYDFVDWELGLLEAYPSLFSVGNVVTGKGNIVSSRKHSRLVARSVVEEYIRVADVVKQLPPLASGQREEILDRVRELQTRIGYSGNYREWIDHTIPHVP